MAATNQVGVETPWNMGEFYGQFYLADLGSNIMAIESRDQDEVIIGEMDKQLIREVCDAWQLYRGRRPETYMRLQMI